MRQRPFLQFIALASAVAVLLAAAPALATTSPGYDISYPQCNSPFPATPAFGIVGVNGGKPYSVNPCFGAGTSPSELAWGGINSQLYANTADPGPALSSHWPNGQVSPMECNTTANPGSDTPACHYDYGWNAAADSYQDAVNGYVSLGWAAPGATQTPVANRWWLDVESANSWTSNTSLNVQALRGEADYVASVGAAGVGFYSSPSAWSSITGGTTAFASYKSWLAGAGSLSTAQAACSGAGFTGGGVGLSQYASGGFDADVDCTPSPALTFGSASQTLTAGAASAAMVVQLPAAASAPVSVQVSSSSSQGSFATDATSTTWSQTLTLQIPAGQTAAPAFYYRDQIAGTPTITASASGYANATQVETVKAGALKTLTISPTSAQIRVGSTQSFSASGADAYGNRLTVTPTWSVSPSLGTFSANPANPVTFTAATVGTGTITATSGGVSGTASVSVTQKRKH
jgi:hypothetical protein